MKTKQKESQKGEQVTYSVEELIRESFKGFDISEVERPLEEGRPSGEDVAKEASKDLEDKVHAALKGVL